MQLRLLATIWVAAVLSIAIDAHQEEGNRLENDSVEAEVHHTYTCTMITLNLSLNRCGKLSSRRFGRAANPILRRLPKSTRALNPTSGISRSYLEASGSA